MEPVVTTTAGRVRGRAEDHGWAFLGVPYAAPPFGRHRLLAPSPPEPWEGVRDALAYGPTSQQPEDEIQGGIPEPSIPGEDILTANIFTPDLGDARLPVLVWIHGGGFFAGSPASPWYRGTRFARDGVVVVTIGYRLGAEGFLALDGAPLNRAVLDWLAALEWVQANIGAFGGDPGQVTVAGQSAGAVACTTLLAMPRARGLFRRAVSMSGVALAVSRERAHETAATIAADLGVPPTRGAVAGLPFQALHAAQLRVLAAGQGPALPEPDLAASGRMPFVPVVDGDLLPAKPLRLIAGGHGADLDLLVGATHDEACHSVAQQAAGLLEEDHLGLALAGLGFPDGYRELHRGSAPAEVLGRAVTDRMFRSRVQRLADARLAAPSAPAPGAAPPGAPAASRRTFAYEFRWPSPLAGGAVGAAHCIDIPFAFDTLDAPEVADLTGPAPPQALADLVHAAWVGFVTAGDPGWPAYDGESRQMMLFDVESGPASDPWHDERLLWEPA